ncbi:MAG: amino acid adenylation domain-containing protein [Candidatus Competibacteraceae bacterium]|nr:amino acid adenylation domain-containing protein [Candidatus Competibacteraceae bacterium]
MMTTLELLSFLKERGVEVWADTGALRFSAPKGAMTAELKQQLTDRKAELLAFLGKLRSEQAAADAIPRVEGEAEPALSFAQQRLWLLEQFGTGEPAYNVGIRIEWRGPIHLDNLRKSFVEIVRRHAVLRTAYPDRKGRPYLRVAEDFTLPFEVVDLSGPSEQDQALQVGEKVLEAGRYPFRLKEDLPIRITVLRTGERAATLVLVIHHIACDAWSMGLLVGEMARLYAAFQRQERASLPALSIRYSDFARWQRGQLQGDYLAEQLAYWKSQLKDPPPPLQLPVDHPRPGVQTFRGAREPFDLGRELSASLDEFCRARQTTMFSLLLALFGLLLYRYTSADDILIGTPAANRARRQLEPLIGFFVNTVVLRARPSAAMSFDALLEQIHATVRDSFTYQDIPFESLIEHVQTGRDLAHSALFQVLFSYQNAPRQDFGIAGVELDITEIDTLTAKFDLSVTLGQIDGQIKGWIEYNTDLFERATIERLIAHYENLSRRVLQDSSQELAAVDFLPRAERSRILETFNQERFELPEGRLVHQLFEASADRHPAEIAVQFDEKTLTYAELEQRSNQLAHHLIALGVGPEIFVGVLLDRDERMVVALLGILKAGGAYVPLDPSYPVSRLQYIVEDTAAPIIVSTRSLQGDVPSAAARVVLVDDDEALSGYPTHRPAVATAQEQLAYVIHTSGSSGRPKGVQISHRNAVSFLLASHRYFPVRLGDTLLAVTTLSFDISVLEIFLPLLGGGRIRLVSRDAINDGAQLRGILQDEPITYLQATPSTWKILLKSGWESHPGLTMLCGGEAMPVALANQLTAGGGRLWNCYGPTETTVWSTYERIEPGADRITIGRPIANETAYILDARLQPVPIGVTGTLYIGGPGVSRGYLNRPDLTRERFIADPFSPEPGAILYDTGDLARFRADGHIEYLGRNDFQVKVRGFRIELPEIEAVIAESPEIADVAVIQEGSGEDQRLVAYLVARAERRLSVNEIKDRIKARLPGYMAPSAFVYLDRLPLTPNGKIDRKRLPARNDDRPDLQTEFAAAATETQKFLVALWQELLDIKTIGIRDNFFDLGGHSLLVVEMHSRLQETLQRTFPVIELFRYTTIADLAGFLDSGSQQAVMDTEEVREKRAEGKERLQARFRRRKATMTAAG